MWNLKEAGGKIPINEQELYTRLKWKNPWLQQYKLMRLLSGTTKDPKILSLIRKYLQSGVMINGVVIETEEGT